MNQLERVRNLLAKVTYKPGWKLEAIRDPLHSSWSEPKLAEWERVIIVVSWRAKDVFDPNKEIMLQCNRSLDHWDLERLDDGQIIDYFIYRTIFEAEEHEIKEWFKFDGIQVKDPHLELKHETADTQRS